MGIEAVLMLCDKPVYNITDSIVLNKDFCPFTDLSDPGKAYVCWRSKRGYLKSNRLAEQVIKQTGGFSTKGAKRRLSLSDGFWVQYNHDRTEKTLFSDISPYLNEFSQAEIYPGNSNSRSTPEITLGGSQPKRWIRDADGLTFMRKIEDSDQLHAEMLAVKLARRCGIPVMNTFIELDSGRIFADDYTSAPTGHGTIYLVNMTSADRSLIPLDQLGIGVLGYNPANVAAAYNKAGVNGSVLPTALCQVVFDGIVGNADRETNNSNWAVFMDNRSGERIPSWMYDFNWANTKETNVQGVTHIAAHIKQACIEDQAIKQAKHIGGKCVELGIAVWENNAKLLIEKLGASKHN